MRSSFHIWGPRNNSPWVDLFVCFLKIFHRNTGFMGSWIQAPCRFISRADHVALSTKNVFQRVCQGQLRRKAEEGESRSGLYAKGPGATFTLKSISFSCPVVSGHRPWKLPKLLCSSLFQNALGDQDQTCNSARRVVSGMIRETKGAVPSVFLQPLCPLEIARR